MSDHEMAPAFDDDLAAELAPTVHGCVRARRDRRVPLALDRGSRGQPGLHQHVVGHAAEARSVKPEVPGYSIRDHVFSPTDMEGVGEALAAATVERTKAGARHVLKVPAVRELGADSRLIEVARQFVGPTATPFRATLFWLHAAALW